MNVDSRLSGVLHVLLHLGRERDPMPSDRLAQAMGTNPVVIRRLMAGPRERGYVRSVRGHGGGWALARELSEITLLDVYEALGRPTLLAVGHRHEAPKCGLERAVNAVLDRAFHDAEALLLERLGDVSLAQLAADARFGACDSRGADASADLERDHGSR